MIRLVPMTEDEYRFYRAELIQGYAEDKVRSGNWSAEESLKRSEQETDQLLPNGIATSDHYLFSIHDNTLAKNVGILWFAVVNWGGKRLAFIYDIQVDATMRGKGYGTQALKLLEEKVKALDLDTIGLHVFGFNHTAQALYEKMGYDITNINMAKKLT